VSARLVTAQPIRRGRGYDAAVTDEPLAPNGWTRALLEGFRGGLTPALREIYRMHAEDIAAQLRFGFTFESHGRAHRFVGYGSAFELHDALHETFRRAFEPRARMGYDGIRPYGAYLRTIARNVVLRAFRRREQAFPEIGEGELDERAAGPWSSVAPDPEREVGREQVAALVREFMATLSPEDRRLLTLRFVEGRSQRDAAQALGLGRQQVRTRESKLREQLVDHLHRRGESSWIAGGLTPVLALALAFDQLAGAA
jgi:RNA polymerase sigma factor (sigma-70 family)